MKIADTIRFITSHPLNSNRKLSAVGGWLRWQIGSRLVPGPVAVPFVNSTRLLVSPGMTGATGNIYSGLHEFADMGFLLHLLRPDDLFYDVGANVGTYTILASAAIGAQSVSLEPVPQTFRFLQDNISLNGVSERVTALNAGVGHVNGVLSFTSDLDTVNHVLENGAGNQQAIEVSVITLDALAEHGPPLLIKIDVEGYETNVIAGGKSLFADGHPVALIMELNGSGNRYGFDESALHRKILDSGFESFSYCPLLRQLSPLKGKTSQNGNTLYIRDFNFVMQRVSSAPKFSVNGLEI